MHLEDLTVSILIFRFHCFQLPTDVVMSTTVYTGDSHSLHSDLANIRPKKEMGSNVVNWLVLAS